MQEQFSHHSFNNGCIYRTYTVELCSLGQMRPKHCSGESKCDKLQVCSIYHRNKIGCDVKRDRLYRISYQIVINQLKKWVKQSLKMQTCTDV